MLTGIKLCFTINRFTYEVYKSLPVQGSSLLACCAVPIVKSLRTFRGMTIPSSLASSSPLSLDSAFLHKEVYVPSNSWSLFTNRRFVISHRFGSSATPLWQLKILHQPVNFMLDILLYVKNILENSVFGFCNGLYPDRNCRKHKHS